MVTFKDCVFQDVSKLQIQYNEPIFLEVPDYNNPCSYLGGFNLDNILISYPTDFSFFRVLGWTTLAGIKDITGNFTIFESNNNPVMYSKVADTINCNYKINYFAQLPSTTVLVNTLEDHAYECNQQDGLIELTRASVNISYPLTVKYEYSGSAKAGDDIHLPVGGIVIPAFQTTITDTIRARSDNLLEEDENIDYAFLQGNLFTISGENSANIILSDCIPSAVNLASNKSVRIYPNPAKNFIRVENNLKIPISVRIYDLHGRQLLCKQIFHSDYIDISSLPQGMAVMEILTAAPLSEYRKLIIL